MTRRHIEGMEIRLHAFRSRQDMITIRLVKQLFYFQDKGPCTELKGG